MTNTDLRIRYDEAAIKHARAVSKVIAGEPQRLMTLAVIAATHGSDMLQARLSEHE